MDLPTALAEAAAAARTHAYAPYSRFLVGAAVLGADGRIHAGCNVENASFGLTCCAERNAIFAAVAGGMRAGELTAVCLATGGSEPAVPCGACLQVIAEFAAPGLMVHCVADGGAVRSYTLDELLPARFALKRPAGPG